MQIEIFGVEREIDDSLIAEGPDTVTGQLRQYEAGERYDFDLRVEFPEGFTGAVMREMSAIPAGETRTYGELADRLGTAAIAVGQACGRNPLPIVVPCHRVVAADSLGGYGGGLPLKRRLLDHEGATVRSK